MHPTTRYLAVFLLACGCANCPERACLNTMTGYLPSDVSTKGETINVRVSWSDNSTECSATNTTQECANTGVELLFKQEKTSGGEAGGTSMGVRSLPSVVGVQVNEKADRLRLEIVESNATYESQGAPTVEDNSSGTCGGTCEKKTFKLVKR